MSAAPKIDLVSASSFAAGQPHDQFRWLREHDPVHWHPHPSARGFWALTRYQEVWAVGRDAKTFSSHAGGIMLDDPGEEALAQSRSMMLHMDPPQHGRYRMLVSREFMPRSAKALKPRIEQMARRIVDEVIERGECDLVSDIAGVLPSYVIAELMGIPLEDGRRLYDLTEKMHASPSGPEGEFERRAAGMEMLAYAMNVAERKKNTPGNDLATKLLNSEIDGDRLTPMEYSFFFLLLINAGGDTTRNLLAGGMLALFRHPEQRRKLQANLDAMLPSAVEEMLRYVSPVIYMRRTATCDTELGGKTIRAGDKVAMYYGAANRDPAMFPDPDKFDAARTPNEHIAFGGGNHYCLGSHIARVEIQAMLREILTRLPDIEQAGEPKWLESNFISGPAQLPVRFTAAPGGTGFSR